MDTDAHGSELLHRDVTEKVIGCAFTVHNELGHGFLERVYENALAVELRERGFAVELQKHLMIRYHNVVVGDYIADMIVNEQVLIEVKAAQGLDNSHTAQCLNYLKATGIRVGLLLNFGSTKLQFKRLIF